MKVFKYIGNGNINGIEAEKISLDDLKDSWLDIKEDLPENVFGINIDKNLLVEDEYCQVEDGPNYTLTKFSYIGKEGTLKKVYIISLENAMISFHKEDCPAINKLIKNLKPITRDEKENIVKFNDFILAQLLYSIVDENMTEISRVDDLIENVIKNINNISPDEIDKLRNHVKILSRVILYQSYVIDDIKKGSGEFINKKNIYIYCEDILRNLDKYGKLVGRLEKEIGATMDSFETKKLAEYTEYTARLSVAIEILTRASVLLMIPNSIFTIWPSIFEKNDLVFGISNWEVEIIVAITSIILSQIIISIIYKRLKKDII